MSISVEELTERLSDKRLPGGSIVIEAHEAAIVDDALRANDFADGVAHPFWFIVTSLRCMGISVDELCALADQQESDLLLFGNCEVDQESPMRVGQSYRAEASIGRVGSKTTRDGSRLDSVDVVVSIRDAADSAVGTVTSTYLFKRGR
ncbi:hypothetical protein A5719_21780 [Mycolicibacterium peregrinum]|uniref:hypothetical protein n=1 Tax=Mycolicibacterium peregrinum TaxID=43304 RepID=UPI0007EB6E72|nr:hypothetical protein [Mycolicibacterium peregrinum]OBF37447.1 hypothetical protein A5719_21780 [Mycolicibacterium peregrinum]